MHIKIFLQLRWETLRIPIPDCYCLWRKGDQLPRKLESIWISPRSGEVVAAGFTQERRRNWDLPMERKSPIRILRKFSFYLPASRVEKVFTSCGSLLPQVLQPAKMSISTTSSAAASSTAVVSAAAASALAPRYPSLVVRQINNLIGGYYLEGDEYSNIAVLSVPSFVSLDSAEIPF